LTADLAAASIGAAKPPGKGDSKGKSKTKAETPCFFFHSEGTCRKTEAECWFSHVPISKAAKGKLVRPETRSRPPSPSPETKGKGKGKRVPDENAYCFLFHTSGGVCTRENCTFAHLSPEKVAECEVRKAAKKAKQLSAPATPAVVVAAPAVVMCVAALRKEGEDGQDRVAKRSVKDTYCSSFAMDKCLVTDCPFAHLTPREIEILRKQKEKRRKWNLEQQKEPCAAAITLQPLPLSSLGIHSVVYAQVGTGPLTEASDTSCTPCLHGVARTEVCSVRASPLGVCSSGECRKSEEKGSRQESRSTEN
jgi:hypothetical protein